MINRPGTAEFPHEISLTIPIVPNIEVAATQTAEAVAGFMEFDREQIDEVKHALIEACINAFEHSNSNENKVYIRFIMKHEDLTVIIQDFGQGFDVESVEKPNIESKFGNSYKRGWGLMLIESLMDSVTITSSPAGTVITMTKLRVRSSKNENGAKEVSSD